MGKGIATHIEKGEYSVVIQLDTAAPDAEKDRIEDQISDLESDLSNIESDIDSKEGEIDALELLLPPIESAINTTTQERDQALSNIASNTATIATNTADIASLEETKQPLVYLYAAIQSQINILNHRINELEALLPS